MADGITRWGILGSGRIAGALAEAVNASDSSELVAIGSRSQASADRFGDQFDISNRYDSYEAVLADAGVDVVYIALPNHLHAPWSIRCAQAGKHILCEKPMAMDAAQAQTVLEAVRQHDVFFMEAFMYRCHPQTARLVGLIRENAIGRVRLIQANFSFGMDPARRESDVRTVNAWGGGGIMDVGCYTLSMSRLLAGAAMGQPFANPTELGGSAMIDPKHKMDWYAVAAAKFPGDIVANMWCGMWMDVDWTLRIWGEAGHIEVPNPWKPPAQEAQIMVWRQADEGGSTIQAPEKVVVNAGADLYTIEVDTVNANLQNRQAPAPCHTWDDSLGNMQSLDMWREAVGLAWEQA